MSLNPSVFSTKSRRAIYGTAAFCLLSAVALGVIASNRWFPATSISSAIANVPDLAVTASAKTEPAATPEVQQTPAPVNIKAELIVISPRGFDQTNIRKPAGKYLFAIVNKSSFPNMVLRLQTENRTILRTIEMPRNRRRASILMTLEPGRYSIVDLTRPEMVCNIEITP